MRTVFETSFDEFDDVNEAFEDWKGIRELTVPVGWTPDWATPSGNERKEDGIKSRPEYDLKDKRAGHKEVLTGRFAANFNTRFHSHNACLYRKIKEKKGIGCALL